MAISPKGCTLAKLLNTSGRDMDLFNYIVAITEVLCCFPRHHLLAGDWPFFTIEVVGTGIEKLEKIYNHMTPRGLQHESTFKEKKRTRKRNAHWGGEFFATSLRMFLSSTGLCGWSMTPGNLLRAFADVRASVVFAYVELLQKRMFKNPNLFHPTQKRSLQLWNSGRFSISTEVLNSFGWFVDNQMFFYK